MSNELVWQNIGKDAFMAKRADGFVHVMKLGKDVWSVTLNGRVVGSAKSADAGKAIAEALA